MFGLAVPSRPRVLRKWTQRSPAPSAVVVFAGEDSPRQHQKKSISGRRLMAPSVMPCAIIALISLIRKLTRPRAARRPRHAKLIEAFAAGEYPNIEFDPSKRVRFHREEFHLCPTDAIGRNDEFSIVALRVIAERPL